MSSFTLNSFESQTMIIADNAIEQLLFVNTNIWKTPKQLYVEIKIDYPQFKIFIKKYNEYFGCVASFSNWLKLQNQLYDKLSVKKWFTTKIHAGIRVFFPSSMLNTTIDSDKECLYHYSDTIKAIKRFPYNYRLISIVNFSKHKQ